MLQGPRENITTANQDTFSLERAPELLHTKINTYHLLRFTLTSIFIRHKGEPWSAAQKGLNASGIVEGPKGDQGDPGPEGPKGDAGEQGLPGERGANGTDGTKGDRGEDGVGQQGMKGEIGPQGEPGADGPKGNTIPYLNIYI